MSKVTDDQIRGALEATYGNRDKAAKLLGVAERTIYRRITAMDNVPAARGLSPSAVLLGADGEVKLQWMKPDKVKLEEEARHIFDAMMSKIPRVQPIPPPRKNLHEELMNWHTLTDFHYGMLSWGEETGGADWDQDIAERLLLDWFGMAIKQAPKATHGVLNQLGDFLHYDSFEAVTPTSHNILDASARPQQMIRGAIRILRQLIDMMLRKYDTVHVIMAEGNHDIYGSAWLRESFAEMYKDEPRVTVDVNPDPYYAHEWGDVALFVHHGHKRRITANIAEVFVRKFRELYGRTKKAYAHMGHMHHKDAKEKTLMEVEQHPTMAAADAHASRGGWLSERVAQVITYHKKYGEVARLGITPEMIEDSNDA